MYGFVVGINVAPFILRSVVSRMGYNIQTELAPLPLVSLHKRHEDTGKIQDMISCVFRSSLCTVCGIIMLIIPDISGCYHYDYSWLVTLSTHLAAVYVD